MHVVTDAHMRRANCRSRPSSNQSTTIIAPTRNEIHKTDAANKQSMSPGRIRDVGRPLKQKTHALGTPVKEWVTQSHMPERRGVHSCGSHALLPASPGHMAARHNS